MDAFLSNASKYLISYGLNLVAALAIFIIGKWVAGVVAKLAERTLLHSKVERTLAAFLRHLAYIALMIVVIIAALSQLGVQTTSFVAVLGAAALAVGLALQGSLANFAAGVLMVLFRPFKVGDVIDAAGTTGEVVEVQLFTTVLNTLDNRRVIVPNAHMTSGVITNYSTNPQRRVDLVFGISYEDDIRTAKRIIEETLAAEPRLLKTPEPTVGVVELSETRIQIAVRPWVLAEHYWPVYFKLMEEVPTAFRSHGLRPPHLNHFLHAPLPIQPELTATN